LQNFHYAFTDWLPFYWAGYRQTTRYTYVIQDISNENNTWNAFSDETKKNISKARDKYQLTIKRGISPDLLIQLNELIFKRQGKKLPGAKTLKRLIELAILQNQGDIWGVYDEEGRLHAAQFLVWDTNCAYCIAGGVHPELRKSKAHSFLLWEVIKYASTKVSSFNFMGSMIEGVEYFNHGFGSKQMPYFVISKGKMNLLDRLKLKLSI
jgi:lipid II:glycine glycyltransferase (peptidoglycan interpeptide bridge formation enzyme)